MCFLPIGHVALWSLAPSALLMTEALCLFLPLPFPFSPFLSPQSQLNPDVHIRLFFDITQDPD